MMRLVGIALCVLAAPAMAWAGEPPKAEGPAGFAARPTVARADNTLHVRFAVSAPTDVEVAVVGADGGVVRHLAAGALGEKVTPPPPLKAGLAQDIAWDGNDDAGKPAPAGAKVRVRLGMSTKLGRMLMDEPAIGWSPRAARVGPDGLLYVLSEHAQTKSTFTLQAYSRDGKYVKTIMPYPADLPADRLKGLTRVQLPDGRRVPQIPIAAFRDLYPDSTGMRPQAMPITSKGHILLVNASRTHNSNAKLTQRVLVVDTDGGTPLGSYLGPITSSDQKVAGLCWLALSPDEKFIYTSGQQKLSGYDENLGTPPLHCVFRVGWDDKDAPRQPFIGELGKPGNDETHLNQPRGMDTDAAGRLYVCDWANNRVAIFDCDGKWAGKIAIDSPDQVAVDRKTGAVYILTWKLPPDAKQGSPAAAPWYPASNVKYNPASVAIEQKITKFAGANPTTQAASVNIGRTYCVMSLDTTAPQPTLWLARTFVERAPKQRGVEKVIDQGNTLTPPVEVLKPRSIPDVYQIAASPVSDDVFVHSYSESRVARVDGRTGEVKVLPMTGADVAVTPAGNPVVFNLTDYFKTLGRVDQYDRDGKPANFAGLATNAVKDIPGSHWGHEATGPKGFSVSPRGDLVLIGPREKVPGVWQLAPAGTFREAVVHGTQGADGSPVVDAAGNIYVASAARPAGELVPAGLADQPAAASYSGFYGSVVKFGPSGGRFFYPPADKAQPWPPPDADQMLKLARGQKGGDVYVAGALWVRPGFTVSPTGPWCGCYTSRFCVDGFGRVWIPDVGQFSVFAVDANNNPLIRFGEYGNADSQGPTDRLKQPAIPFAWPYAVSVGKSAVYVTDFINRRIVRVDMAWAAEAQCDAR